MPTTLLTICLCVYTRLTLSIHSYICEMVLCNDDDYKAHKKALSLSVSPKQPHRTDLTCDDFFEAHLSDVLKLTLTLMQYLLMRRDRCHSTTFLLSMILTNLLLCPPFPSSPPPFFLSRCKVCCPPLLSSSP